LSAGAVQAHSRLRAARRVVVKIGSALLVDAATGRLNRQWLETLAEDLDRLRKRGQDVVVVSSGAIALGRRHLGLVPGRLKLEESQAAAAVGQIRLAHAWKEVLEHHGHTVAQVLLTFGDTEQRRRYLNARNTLTTLLRLGAIAVINENDTVATAEIRYGDNDRLAARVAQMVSADCLVLLSDVDGLYSADPARDAAARFIPEVLRITPEIEAMAGGAASDVGSGGMATEALGCEDCRRGRLQHVCGDGSRAASTRADRTSRPLHVVRCRGVTGHGAQAVDCRHAAAGRRARGRRGRRARAAGRQEPAACGRGARGRAF
jgi:glutamate 5-kinase